MPGTPGYLFKVDVSPDGITWTTVGGLASAETSSLGREEIDTSAAGEVAGSAIAGRHLFEGSCDGISLPADAGQAMVMAALAGTCQLHVRHMPDGVKGRRALSFIKPAKLSSAVKDAAKWGFSWKAIAQPVDF